MWANVYSRAAWWQYIYTSYNMFVFQGECVETCGLTGYLMEVMVGWSE